LPLEACSPVALVFGFFFINYCGAKPPNVRVTCERDLRQQVGAMRAG